jgi:hypothetical protein
MSGRGPQQIRLLGVAFALLALASAALIVWVLVGRGGRLATQVTGQKQAQESSWDVGSLRQNVPGLLIVRNYPDAPSELRFLAGGSGWSIERTLWKAPRGAVPRLLGADEASGRVALWAPGWSPGQPAEIFVLEEDGTVRPTAIPGKTPIWEMSGVFDRDELLLATAVFPGNGGVVPGKSLRVTGKGELVPLEVTGAPRDIPLMKLLKLRDGTGSYTIVAGIFSPTDVGNPVLAELRRSGESWRVTGHTYTAQSDVEPWDDLLSAAPGTGPGGIVFLQRHVDPSRRVLFDVARIALGALGKPRTIARDVSAESSGPASSYLIQPPRLGAGPLGSFLAAIEETVSSHPPGTPEPKIGGPSFATYRLERIDARGKRMALGTSVTDATGQGLPLPAYDPESWMWLDSFVGASGTRKE